MVHQMAQEGALWPDSVIRLGPHWRNSKNNMGQYCLCSAECWHLKTQKGTIVNMVGVVENAVAHS